MTDKNIQMTQRNETNTDWDNLYPKTKAENVQTQEGTDLQTEIDSLKSSVSDGKSEVGVAITDVDPNVVIQDADGDGISSFDEISTAIRSISTGKKFASGSVIFPANAPGNQNRINVDITLPFTPSVGILVDTSGIGIETTDSDWLTDALKNLDIDNARANVSISTNNIQCSTSAMSNGDIADWFAIE